MTPAARVGAAIEILDMIAAGESAERCLTTWGRRNRYAGSGDRAAVRSHVFDVLRRWRSCAAHGGGADGRALMLGWMIQQGHDPDLSFTGEGYGPAVLSDAERAAIASDPVMTDAERLDMPDWLMPLLEDSLGERRDTALEALRHRGPIWLRVNLTHGAAEDAATRLAEDGIDAAPDGRFKTALQVTGGERKIANSAAYRDGLIELQDIASQEIAFRVPLGGRLLDFCAGGGGKALAVADHAATSGVPTEIFVHDADAGRMVDLDARAARAGATLTALASGDLEQAGPFNTVICDVPCSGSGAWRRAPEGKWRLDAARLTELQHLQDTILTRASGLVRPGGTLCYMTCSLLEAENATAIEGFLARNPDWICRTREQLLPEVTGGDGFYFAELTKS